MLPLETKQSGGKLLPHSDLRWGGGLFIEAVSRSRQRKRDLFRYMECMDSFALSIVWWNQSLLTTFFGSSASFALILDSSASSIGTATLVGFGLLNYRWVFSAGRFLQSAVANGTSNPQLWGPVIRTSNSRQQVSLTSGTTRANPSSGRWKYGLEIAENFVESGDLHVTFGFFYMS